MTWQDQIEEGWDRMTIGQDGIGQDRGGWNLAQHRDKLRDGQKWARGHDKTGYDRTGYDRARLEMDKCKSGEGNDKTGLGEAWTRLRYDRIGQDRRDRQDRTG